MDCKHIPLECPRTSGSYYFNYKGTFSIIHLALVNANYKFPYIDVGCNGRVSDGGVFRDSSLNKAMKNNSLNIPPPKMMDDNCTKLPYLIVADDVFPLLENKHYETISIS